MEKEPNKLLENLFSLKGKTCLLTGAVGFFGRYFARALVASGASVMLVDCDQSGLEELSNELNNSRPSTAQTIDTLCLDFYNRDSIETVSNLIKTSPAQVLINNAFDFSLRTGFNDPSGRLENATFDQLQASFESGIWWATSLTQIFGNHWISQKVPGNIINITSMYGVVVPSPDLYLGTEKFNPPGYSMAKAGLLQFTKYTASMWGGHQIRANAISPGAIPNMESKTFNAVSEQEREFLQRLVDRTCLKRVGHPRDLVGALIFLASDASSYLTGQNIIIDGGWTIT